MSTVLSETNDMSPDPAQILSSLDQTSVLGPEYAESHDHHILIVDDEETVRTLFASYLGETYTCETAANAQEALDTLARARFGLVLTDMQMPGLSGVELLRKITELY